MAQFDGLLDKVIRVGDGRGFVVAHGHHDLVITASHCLPELPPCHPAAYTHERTHANLLGPLGSEPTVWAEVLFVDPVADIAVLGEPDGQVLYDENDAYCQLMPDKPLAMETVPETARAWILSLEGEWVECKVRHQVDGPLWIEDAALPIVGGMSGSPILNDDGEAIGVMCVGISASGGPNPSLAAHLPCWLGWKLIARAEVTAKITEIEKKRAVKRAG